MNKKFWKWKNQTAETAPTERTLFLNGTIAEESWFDDDITPQLFKDELLSGSGDITVWINSPGGDCVAAAQIYNMLMDYKGNVTVKIDGIAASAASVIAMAGAKVYVSPVSMLMIHNPMTVAMGNAADMEKAIEMLSSVKDSIINAYEIKTGLSRARLSHLMDAETWMDANKAVNKAWEAAKAFAETHTTDKGTLTAEDTATYERMEQEIQDLSREIQRRERQEAMDAELAKPVSAPITGKPMSGRQEDAPKTGRASKAYKDAFSRHRRYRKYGGVRPYGCDHRRKQGGGFRIRGRRRTRGSGLSSQEIQR